ncbi:MAG: NAD(P)/FAD-dependent oxidoreductase, partial [Deltaproteobacteria bacterium]|nr:NAD(P)/FAD-dependent oxidoreductase [Deltaproteobacteria bacterium]
LFKISIFIKITGADTGVVLKQYFKNSYSILLLIWSISVSFWGCATVPLPKTVNTDYDVIVVGAGMGGLSGAAHVAVGGKRVLLLEQHYKVGGCASSFVRGDFAFDTALHEMSLGGGDGFLRNIIDKAGVLDKVKMIRIPSLGKSIFPGMEIEQKEGVENFIEELVLHWPGEEENIRKYFATIKDMSIEASELRDVFFGSPLKSMFLKMAIPFKQHTLAKYNNNTLQEVLDDFFTDDKLKAAVAQFWLYHGPPPSNQWALIYMMGQYSYVQNGGWQFVGSSSSLSDAYAERIRELGGEIKTGTLVNSINISDGHVTGVTTDDGTTYTSRYVISNADPFQTFYKLVGKDKTPKKIVKQLEKMVPSTSLAGVYLGLDVPASYWGINDYEIFYNTSWDHELMYKKMIEGKWDEGALSMTFYSNLPDSYYAPEGMGAIVLHSYSAYDYWSDDEKEYEKQKEHMIDTLINMANDIMPGIRDHIVYQEGMTPKTINHYTLNYKGAPYGMDFTIEQKDRMEIKTPIAGLYLAGSWVFPSHSVGMAQVSGYMAAKSILKNDK